MQFPKQTVNRPRSLALKLALVAGMVCKLWMPNVNVSAAPAQTECAPVGTGNAIWVTAKCVDPLYNRPVIDSESDETAPVPHHKVSGHFEGTDKKFNFYFPPKKQWQGRLFNLVYPLQDENATDVTISFGADSGAYTVQTNGGGYRVDAAAVKFSKTVAAKYYVTSKRIYGYIYGGSGGSYQTIGAIENTSGVWDGAVPYIPGARQQSRTTSSRGLLRALYWRTRRRRSRKW